MLYNHTTVPAFRIDTDLTRRAIQVARARHFDITDGPSFMAALDADIAASPYAVLSLATIGDPRHPTLSVATFRAHGYDGRPHVVTQERLAYWLDEVVPAAHPGIEQGMERVVFDLVAATLLRLHLTRPGRTADSHYLDF